MNDKIGEKIRQYRRQKGLSQEQVADYLNITQSTYSRIEKGESKTWTEYLERLCLILEINPEDLFKTDRFINNSINTNHGVGYSETTNLLSEKLIDQMEKRIQEKDQLIVELRKQIESLT